MQPDGIVGCLLAFTNPNLLKRSVAQVPQTVHGKHAANDAAAALAPPEAGCLSDNVWPSDFVPLSDPYRFAMYLFLSFGGGKGGREEGQSCQIRTVLPCILFFKFWISDATEGER